MTKITDETGSLAGPAQPAPERTVPTLDLSATASGSGGYHIHYQYPVSTLTISCISADSDFLGWAHKAQVSVGEKFRIFVNSANIFEHDVKDSRFPLWQSHAAMALILLLILAPWAGWWSVAKPYISADPESQRWLILRYTPAIVCATAAVLLFAYAAENASRTQQQSPDAAWRHTALGLLETDGRGGVQYRFRHGDQDYVGTQFDGGTPGRSGTEVVIVFRPSNPNDSQAMLDLKPIRNRHSAFAQPRPWGERESGQLPLFGIIGITIGAWYCGLGVGAILTFLLGLQNRVKHPPANSSP